MAEAGARAAEPRWDGIVRRQIAYELRVINEAERSVEVIASTDTIDAHGDILEQDWDLKRYKKNPVVLWNHNRCWDAMGATPKDMLPIGFGSNTKVAEGKLESKLTFVDEKANEMAELVWQGFVQGSIRAVSVGFKPGKVTQELRPNGRTVYRLSECELREISVVPMGSNPEAVAKSIEDQERAWLDSIATKSAEVLDRERTAPTNNSPAAEAEKDNHMDLKELQAAYEKAVNELATANATIATVKGKSAEDMAGVNTKLVAAEALVVTLTKERDEATKSLTAEKTLVGKLEGELKSANERIAVADATVAKTELDARQGKKFTPAEREELDDLVKSLGIARVLKFVDARPDIAITHPVIVDGKPVSEKSAGAPPPAEPAEPVDAGADLVKAANSAVDTTIANQSKERAQAAFDSAHRGVSLG